MCTHIDEDALRYEANKPVQATSVAMNPKRNTQHVIIIIIIVVIIIISMLIRIMIIVVMICIYIYIYVFNYLFI